MSPRRRLFRIFSFGALLAAVLLLWWDRTHVPAPAPRPDAAPAPTAPALPTARPWPSLRDLVNVGILNQARVTVQVVDDQYQPLAGVTVRLADETGTSDGAGRIVLEGVPWGQHRFRVEPPWLVQRQASSPPIVSGVQQELLLVLAQGCPGPVRIQHPDAQGIAEVSLGYLSAEGGGLSLDPPLVSDDAGWIYVETRPCGAVQFDLRLPGEGAVLTLGAEVAGDDAAVVLSVPGIEESILQVVDLDGLPLPAEARSPQALSLEVVGEGRFRLMARQEVITLRVTPEGLFERPVQVPVDGGEHVYVAEEGRGVQVLLTCDTEGCPALLACELTPCTPLSETLHQCDCPEAEASLWMQEAGQPGFERIETVPWGVEYMAVDLRREATVQGQWTGPLPCRASVAHQPLHRLHEVPCDLDGTFLLSELRPGPATLTVRHGDDVGAREIMLSAGRSLDVGELGPASLEIDGWIEADFSLEDATLRVEPWGQVTLAADGWFQIRGLPEGTTSVRLWLDSGQHGSFREWFWLTDSGSLEWSVVQEEGTDVRDPASLEADTGRLRRGDDTGEDSGDPPADSGDSGL